MQTYADLKFAPTGCPPNHKFIIDAVEGGQLKIAATEGFPLKSGRISPYFFNSGLYVAGSELARLSEQYAEKLHDSFGEKLEDCVLFGPPYKGIALANLTAIQLWGFQGTEVLGASNRKEAKGHGEGGLLMGVTDMSGRDVIIIDDVITDGASKRGAVELVRAAGGNVIGGIIAFDRQERGKDTDLSGAQQFEQEFGVPMHAIATFADLIKVFETYPNEGGNLYHGILDPLLAYGEQYGVAF